MAGRGPAPKPTALRALEGTRDKRPGAKAEPRPASASAPPNAPRWMSEPAKAEWRRVAGELHRLGLLTRVDTSALAAYCETYAMWQKAQAKVNEGGLTYETDTIRRVVPEAKLALELVSTMRALMAEFGLTPAARVRLRGAGQPAEQLSLADLLFSGVDDQP